MHKIDDEFLYTHMPQAERIMLEKIPSEGELSHIFSRRFRWKMKALLKYERRSPAMRQFARQIKATVAILLVILSLAFGTVTSVEAYRVRLFEFVTEIWNKFTSIVIHSEDNADNDILAPDEPAYVPDGYYLLEQQSNKYESTIIYCNDVGAEIYFSQKLATQSEFIFDSENADTDMITIGKQNVYVLVNKNTVQVHWGDKLSVYSLIGGLDKEELIKMAESIIKK